MNWRRDYIHTPDDGRGPRRVLVNGKEVQHCYFADTKRGIARCYRDPIRADKRGKRLLVKTHRGAVEVVLIQSEVEA